MITLVHKRKAGEIFTGYLLCRRDSSGNGTHPTLYIKGMGLSVRINKRIINHLLIAKTSPFVIQA